MSLDAVGAAHVGAYGYSRDTTPHLDAVAAAGAVFEAAFTQQPWTLSSHLTMLTGLDPAVHGASRNRAAAPSAITLAQALREQGFATAGFAGERVWMHPRYGHGRGFERYELAGSDARANAPAIVAWLGVQAQELARDPTHRFFLFAHFYDAHSDAKTPLPYSVPPPIRDRYLPEGEPWQRRGGTALLLQLRRAGTATPRDLEFIRAYYDAGVRYVDEYGVGAIVAALRELGLERDTLLVLTSDHGEEIFEHGYVLHGQPYVETTRVPLVLRGPGIAPGTRFQRLVGLAPTLLGLLDLPPLPGAQGWGSSVVADIEGRRWSYVARVRDTRTAGAGGFAVEGAGELYDLDQDPYQQRDVSAQEPQIERQLRNRLLAWYSANALQARRQGAARQRARLAPAEIEYLRAVGYVQ